MTDDSATDIAIRPVRFSDLDAIEDLFEEAFADEYGSRSVDIAGQIRRIRRWYGPLKALSLFPNRFQHTFNVHVAEREGDILGMIQVSPFNRNRTTWRIDHIAVSSRAQRQGIGSQLLRHCAEQFREARTWMLEVNIHNKGAMALYRCNGFQQLAQLTYWSLDPAKLVELAEEKISPLNLKPVSNSDSYLLYQLDTASMPPQVRQIYDRDVSDFKQTLFDRSIDNLKQSVSNTERVQAYVFEADRKCAIGYFNLKLAHTGNQPHVAQLTVHPAYTWLYPELIGKMARLTQQCQPQSLYLASADYQPEREQCLLQIGATDMERTLLMSRSVFHKVRESRLNLESLQQLNSVLRGLQVKQPLPERIDRLSLDDSQTPPDSRQS
ncbi:GNAT family N-acetyltransferase [Synechococcus sp. PCC 7336]|uniref:GNAT family N-acetyltransferase n=1 Tax=Synechococcus sp. PCC 7336 TaxID=195250 RepID=UPI00034C2DEB|nr:GNAT family N-acetyltransferase [Synechococcus sp. PCC 7336]